MQLRKRREVSGELGMSSMSDILFILMMFFMMTSALTAPTALLLSLPGRSEKNNKLADQAKLTQIDILVDGTYLLDGRLADTVQIRRVIEKETQGVADVSKVNFIVSPAANSTAEGAVPILSLITISGANAVLDLQDE